MTYEEDAAELRGAHVPAGDVRPVRTVPDPADVRPRTAAAIEANVRRRLDRNAQELRDRGYAVVDPGTIANLTGGRPALLRMWSDRSAGAQ